ncbi:hypothetical protein LMH87_000416 [Akanthomyces muscarius]|uniref:Uncharacterized protein n=1 Tax=Akanthomyces muscarius TaxID=2231603 RepID=A0A9W8QEH0_AKAMU|nr:hypothetical protein LMH87_000416 [Akanthomyces muscarius]KAJ4155159.1 hypothetical protein LMH87_000416 [Akanthomyces muscarius]
MFLAATISVTFANGTKFSTWINGTQTYDSPIQTQSDQIWGDWSSTGFTFSGAGTDGLAKYIVEGCNPARGISGSMILDSIAPGHYPCGPDRAGETEVPLPPGGGWSNVVPGGAATVNFTIHGSWLSFTGLGYHDHNWGKTKIPNPLKIWYWGHALLGPYVLVWFDGINRLDKELILTILDSNELVPPSEATEAHFRGGDADQVCHIITPHDEDKFRGNDAGQACHIITPHDEGSSKSTPKKYERP